MHYCRHSKHKQFPLLLACVFVQDSQLRVTWIEDNLISLNCTCLNLRRYTYAKIVLPAPAMFQLAKEAQKLPYTRSKHHATSRPSAFQVDPRALTLDKGPSPPQNINWYIDSLTFSYHFSLTVPATRNESRKDSEPKIYARVDLRIPGHQRTPPALLIQVPNVSLSSNHSPVPS